MTIHVYVCIYIFNGIIYIERRKELVKTTTKKQKNKSSKATPKILLGSN